MSLMIAFFFFFFFFLVFCFCSLVFCARRLDTASFYLNKFLCGDTLYTLTVDWSKTLLPLGIRYGWLFCQTPPVLLSLVAQTRLFDPRLFWAFCSIVVRNFALAMEVNVVVISLGSFVTLGLAESWLCSDHVAPLLIGKNSFSRFPAYVPVPGVGVPSLTVDVFCAWLLVGPPFFPHPQGVSHRVGFLTCECCVACLVSCTAPPPLYGQWPPFVPGLLRPHDLITSPLGI